MLPPPLRENFKNLRLHLVASGLWRLLHPLFKSPLLLLIKTRDGGGRRYIYGYTYITCTQSQQSLKIMCIIHVSTTQNSELIFTLNQLHLIVTALSLCWAWLQFACCGFIGRTLCQFIVLLTTAGQLVRILIHSTTSSSSWHANCSVTSAL